MNVCNVATANIRAGVVSVPGGDRRTGRSAITVTRRAPVRSVTVGAIAMYERESDGQND